MLRLLTASLLALMLSITGVHAQQAPHSREELLAEIFDVLQFDMMFEPMMVQYRQVFEQRLRQADPTLSDEEIELVGDVVFAEIEKTMEPLMRMTAQLLLKYFDEEDMRVMLAFYKTPTGQKTVRVMPQMTSEILAMSQQYILQVGPGMQARIEEALREKGYEL